MKVYHGSLEIVKNPEIRLSNRTLDYGYGFYTTTSYEQAEAWVKRKLSEKKVLKGYVNFYDFDEKAIQELNALIFETPTNEWVDFVMNNRIRKDFVHNYDIVYGPVANDKVYAAFAFYEGGLIDKDTLIKELKTFKLVDQFLFHTEKALETLKYIKAKEVYHDESDNQSK